MELYKEIVYALVCQKKLEISFPREEEIEKAVEVASYEALAKIKCILEDDALSDVDCFQKIEEIVRVFESFGSGCGNRHDFG